MLRIFSATRKKLKLERKGRRNMGGTINITGRYEIGCPLFIFHYTLSSSYFI